MPGMGQILYEKGISEGISQGREEEAKERIGIMLQKGKTPEEISDFCGYDPELIREVEENKETE